MARRACDGDGLLGAFRAAVANLEAHVDEINALNVYPGPRRRHRLEHAGHGPGGARGGGGASAGRPAERIAAAISFGALMGARGNSGVITSQIFRGMAEGLGGKTPVQRPRPRPRPVAGREDGLRRGRQAGRGHDPDGHPRVGRRPRSSRAERDDDIEAVLARDASTPPRGPSPGRRRLLRDPARGRRRRLGRPGALPAVPGRPAAPRRAGAGGGGAAARAAAGADRGRRPLVAHARRGLRLRDDVPAPARRPGGLDVDAIREHLESIGESVLVAGDGRALKVHVHNERPDLVLAYGLGLGTLSRISVENLDNQARDVRETRAAAFTGGAAATGRATAAAPGAALGAPAGRPGRSRPRSASSRSPRATDWRRSSATSASRRSSTAARRRTPAPASCSRPSRRRRPRGHRSCRTTRTSSSRRARSPAMADRPVVVVPTRNAAEGFAALLALDPSLDATPTPGR